MTSTTKLSRVVLFLLLFVWGAEARGADLPERKVTVTGNATIDVIPDEMRWTVQISINDSTVAKAKARHDASLGDALKFIKSFGQGIQDLQTGGIRIDKISYAPENSSAADRPFTCSTQFTFTLTDFDKYGPLCDGFARLDGVEVQSVDYRSSKEEATQREALKQALLTAHDKANDLATTADCYIDKPLLIQEGTIDDGPRPLMRMAMAAPMGSGTPSAVPGQIEITATVTVSYDLFYK